MGVGGYFDHVLRRIDCYPKWVNKFNLNWLYRLYIEPRRLWKRYLIGFPKFIFRIIKYKFGFIFIIT
jgi:N-acetylglucosaminyldiphosphoundecaprenol N-acetyl-beta-D-mannosaminyltransferase